MGKVINKRKYIARVTAGSIFYLLIFLCSLLITGCPNPIIEHIVEPKKITFETNGSSTISSQVIFKGQAVSKPKDPMRSGYNFEGWYRDNLTFRDRWDFNAVPGGDMILFACWSPVISIEITLSGFDQPGNIEFGSIMFSAPLPTERVITVTNTGNRPTGDLTIELSGNNPEKFNLSTSTINSLEETGDWDSFIVVPNDNFSTGVYTAIGRVFNTANGINASFTMMYGVGVIHRVDITIDAPVTFASPDDITTGGETNFSIGAITWSPDDNPFLPSKQYTATVTLAADTDYTFTGLSYATISGENASVSNNTGTAVTLSYTFAATAAQGQFTTIGAIESYLAAPHSGNSITNPVTLPISLVGGLGNMTSSTSNWQQLLSTIEDAGKFVELDLSGSSMTGTSFDPVSTISTGKSRIVSMVLPNTATSIPNGSITNCTFDNFNNLKSVDGANITVIGQFAIANCTSITEANFPLTNSIDDFSFANCTSLTEANFPLATSIGDIAFAGCTSITKVSFPLATSIGDGAFSQCSSLTEASFPIATNISMSAFNECSSLTNVSFPVANTISSMAFYACTSLTLVNIPLAESIGNNAFRNCSSLTEVSFPLVITIGSNSFMDCSSLTGVNLPSVTGINYQAFLNCSSLTTVCFPSANGIDSSSFSGCSSLTEVSFPEVTTIGDNAFQRCYSLIEVSFPLVSSIGNNIFADTGNDPLAITLGATPPTVGTSMFVDIISPGKTVTVWIPSSADVTYGADVFTNASTVDSWGRAFKGFGWNGTYLTGTVNDDITLVFQLY